MAAGIGLVIKIAAETKQAVGDIKDVNSALQGTGSETSKTGKLMSGMKGPALAALGAVAGAAIAAAAAMVEFGKAAWEDHQESLKLASVLKTIPGITQEMIDANEDWITQAMFATHVTDTELREGITGLILVTGDLTTAQQYASAAADLATVANVDYATATSAVEKALVGKTRALMALAPQLDKNKDGVLSVAEAQAILTDETLKGQAAAAAAADPWTTMTLIWGEIKEALGQWILPLFTRLGDWFKDPANQQKIQEFISKIGDMSYQLGMKLLPYLDRFLDWLSSPEGQAQMKRWAQLAGELARMFGQVAGALAKVYEWYRKIPWDTVWKVMRPGQSVPGSSSSAMGYPAPAGVTPYAAGSGRPVTVNFYGPVTDPEGTARAISASLRGSDWRNGRTRRLEPAW